MNTSEALDLSKENIQPLKQGRNAVKLGTALQAQTNAELHQQLMAERERFELLIRMYEGDDPLEPHYEYVRWIEQSFPKHGPESNLVQILENTLAAFKDDIRYKQDLRYAELLIKYIDTQSHPLEIYQIVYDQGLCTMCAPFYKAWAEEYDKINDIKSADRIYELGIRVKAQPVELLPEAQMRFQLSLGRRMLGYQEEAANEEAERNRQALHKLQKKNVYGDREPVGAPGRIKQQVLGSHNTKGNSNAPFKIYQEDDNEFGSHGDGQGKMFPKQGLVNKENTLKAGPWSQQGGKHRNREPPVPASHHGPMFQVHEDEDADMNNGHPKTPQVPRALKPRKIDNFTCPLAVFEPPDPTKQPMYCKHKVYAGGTEFQFEELRAALYNRRHEKLIAARKQQEEEELRRKAETDATYVKTAPDVIGVQDNNRGSEEKIIKMENDPSPHPVQEVDQDSLFGNHLMGPNEEKVESHKSHNVEDKLVEEQKSETHFEEPHIEPVVGFEHKNLHLEGNTSVFHCQSFTVNTKEAMNVVQEMWQSPTPSPAFANNMRASRVFPVSPANVDESGVFKVPIAPAPHVPVAPAKKSIPFPVFSDEEPSPAPTPVKTFQIYSDEAENEQPGDAKTEEPKVNPSVPLPFPIQQSPAVSRATDVATMKMLAFQSDSDEECDILPKPCFGKEEKERQTPYDVPAVTVTQATPVESKKALGFPVHAPVYDEDKFEDMTCNTKAFDFALPSSTPLVGHFQSKADQQAKNNNFNVNGSYIMEDAKKCGTRQDLSIVFEASKERYSSSSGSNGSKTQGSVCTVNTTVPPAQPELLEKLAQISANKSLDEVDRSLGLLNISGSIDPFSTDLIAKLLAHVGYPKKHHLIGLHRQDTDCPALHTNSTVTLGTTKYSVIGELGKGAYARVLKATRDSRPVALKQQRPAWEWEWYIVQELQSRLPPNMMSGFLHMSTGYIYRNASILESEWAQYGSILSVVNKLKKAGKGHDLHLAVLFSVQLVSIVEHLHKCRIIHGDIKPDNFVLFSLPSVDLSEPCLKLIDFGRSIDMTLFQEDTTFTMVVTTDGFQCNEMKEGRPWTYQTDLYGLAGSIYCVLFYDYMKVVKKDKKWQLSSKVPRYMKPALWTDVFSTLLNVESCENQPNLTVLRELLEQNYKEMDQASVQASINKLTNTLLNK